MGKEKYFPDVKLHLHFDFWYCFHLKKNYSSALVTKKQVLYLMFLTNMGSQPSPDSFSF